MNHYVLTRSAFDPKAWSIDANRRRLEVTRTVTVPLMAAQTSKQWSWIVLVDPQDPFRAERLDAFGAAGVPVIPLVWRGEPKAAAWDRRTLRPGRATLEAIAAGAYRAPWRTVMEHGQMLLQTRLDDDDGLAPDAIERYQRAARRVGVHPHPARQILMLPQGVRVYRGLYNDTTHQRNAMHTLVTFTGDSTCVYDYPHAKCQKYAPVQFVDRQWGWLWVRHDDTMSGWKSDLPQKINDRVRDAFPIDWQRLGQLWH